MSLFLDNWNLGDKGFIIDCNNDKESHAQYENGTITIEGMTYSLEGDERPELNEGDIIRVFENGKIEIVYRHGLKEIDLFVTNICNSNCIMCPLSEYSRRKKLENHLSWTKRYIELLPEDLYYINITGGEPTFIKDDLIDILYMIRNKYNRVQSQMLTNGRSFSDLMFLRKIVDASLNGMKYAIPLHSSNKIVHDRITQSINSFIQTDKGIRNLLKLNQKVEIRIVLSKENVDTVFETASYIVNNYIGVFCVNFVAMEMMGNAVVNRERLWMDYDAIFRRIKSSIDLLIRHGIDVQLYNFPLCMVDRGYWSIAANSITDYKIRYQDECEECAVRTICGGWFLSTKQVMNPRVYPVGEK